MHSHIHKHMHIHTCLSPSQHAHTHTQTTDHILTGTHFWPFCIHRFCLLCSSSSFSSSGLLSGHGSEESREVEQSGNSLLIPAEPAFRFAAGLLPNRHYRSHPANQRGTQALMRAEAKSRCGRMDEGFREGAKQGRQWR